MSDRFTNVIGTRCLNTSYAALTAKLQDYVGDKTGRPLSIDFTNVHIVAMRRSEPQFAEITESVDYFVPDSQVLYFTIKLLGGKMEDRVYGPTFMGKCVPNCPAPFTHYFLGASQECLDRLIQFFEQANPDFKLVGSHHGYFGESDEPAIVEEINRLEPDFIWVGLGTPKQQEWVSRNLSDLRRGVVLAVGFAFDVNAGTKSDAPVWMQKCGLTWAHRLASEPNRLFWRYLKYNSQYCWYLLRDHVLGLKPPNKGQEQHSLGHAQVKDESGETGQLDATINQHGKHVNVLGVGVSPITLKTATDGLLRAMEQKRKGYVCVTSAHGITEAIRDRKFKNILRKAFLVTPDGMPLVWVGKMEGFGDRISRVYGPDLMLEVFGRKEFADAKHFFYGGKEGVAGLLKTELERRFPGCKIVGTMTPPFRPLSEQEEDALVAQVSDAKPDIIWVGLSTPKQERFMSAYLHKLDATLMIGVGAAFDFHSKLVPQAPKWMQKIGLEWLFRVCQEPRRLWWRYLKNNPLFLGRLLLQACGVKRYRLH